MSDVVAAIDQVCYAINVSISYLFSLYGLVSSKLIPKIWELSAA